MKSQWLKAGVAMLCCGVLGVMAPTADAQYLYDWDTLPSISGADASGDAVGGNAGADITSVWYASDASYHYFRLDLAAAPSGSNSAPNYSICLDLDNNASTGGPGSHSYVPDELSGIDRMPDMHYIAGSGWSDQHNHGWNGSDYDFDTVSAFTTSNNANTTLEWQIPSADIGSGEFMMWGVSYTQTNGFPAVDLTTGVTAPEPATLSLIGLGGLLAWRRKRQ